MRLFFGLLPDASTREHLLSTASRLSLAATERAVPAANLHMTLAFIGEIPASDLRIFSDMGATFGLQRCTLHLGLIEYWPTSQVIVLAARDCAHQLAAQTDRLREAVAAQVHPGRNRKPWRAHVTLARKVAQAPVLTTMSPVTWVPHSFCLMSSNTDGRESVYTVVDSWSLLDKP